MPPGMERERPSLVSRRKGRPRRRREDLQRNRVMLNLTDEEYEDLLRAAGDQSLGSYLRQVVKRHLAHAGCGS